MAEARPNISTIVRSRWIALRVLVRLLSSVAPGTAARIVARLWMTPGRMAAEPELTLPAPATLACDGLELPLWSFGDGPPVYLVHGWGGRADQLSPLVWPLVESGHKVVLFDGPGHGRA